MPPPASWLGGAVTRCSLGHDVADPGGLGSVDELDVAAGEDADHRPRRPFRSAVTGKPETFCSSMSVEGPADGVVGAEGDRGR